MAAVKSVLQSDSLSTGDAHIGAILADPGFNTALDKTMDYQYNYVQIKPTNLETRKADKGKKEVFAAAVQAILDA